VVEYRRRGIVVITAAGKDTRLRVRLCDGCSLYRESVTVRAERPIPGREKRCFSSPECRTHLLCPPTLLFCVYRRCLPRAWSGTCVKPTSAEVMNEWSYASTYVCLWRVQGQIFCNFLCHCAVWIMFLVDFARRFWSLLISGFFKDMYVVLMLLARLARFGHDIT
jgi:hypothetical protein